MNPTLHTATAPGTTERWSFDPTHSTIGFRVRHLVISKVTGRFTGWTGNLELSGPDHAGSRVDITIDASSVDTHESQRDTHLRSADFLNVERFPTIEFRSRRVESHGEDRWRIIGDLTLHGVTREVVLQAEEGGRVRDPWGGERVGFTARATIDRRDFGLTWNQALETGGFVVGDKVELEIEIEAVKQK